MGVERGIRPDATRHFGTRTFGTRINATRTFGTLESDGGGGRRRGRGIGRVSVVTPSRGDDDLIALHLMDLADPTRYRFCYNADTRHKYRNFFLHDLNYCLYVIGI